VRTAFGWVVAFTLVAGNVVHAQQAPQEGGRGGRGGGAEARIMRFEARPASIRPGESVVLVWATENPSGVTIDPDIGSVAARGQKQVTPVATTTYTLTMRGGPSKTVTVTVAGTAPRATTASANNKKDARMPDGKPDLTGVYGNAGLPAGTPMPTLKPGAEKYRIVRGPNDVRGRTTLGTDCKPLGIPQTYITPYPFQIVQRPNMLVMIFEYPNTFRMIPLDGRPHPDDPDPPWMGNGVGHWEGDTLVIDTIGFNDKTEVHGFMHSESLHVVERFTRQDNGSLRYEVTVEDPNVFAAPWVIPARTFQLRSELDWVEEFVCESNVDYNKLFKQQ
jgi:uncharacterized protein YndB with AHSA1/START domain